MSAPPPGVTCRTDAEGRDNPKYVDVLDEDKPVAGQKFACVSFISPEKILQDKNMFMFGRFLKQWDMAKSLEKYQQFLGFLSYKHSVSVDDLNKDFAEFCETEKDNLFVTTLEDDYSTYLDKNEEKLGKEFDEAHDFKTSVRGLKIRGSFPSLKEAELRCKMLREVDPSHDVYVGPVGSWMPFHPEAYKTGRVEYLEDELNQLMHEKKKNEEKAKREFDARVREAKEKAMKENEQKAKESGSVLTQTIDENGQLVSVRDNPSTVERRLADMEGEVAAADIRAELFEGDNILTGKDHDHGLKDIMDLHAEADADGGGGEDESKGGEGHEQEQQECGDEQEDESKDGAPASKQLRDQAPLKAIREESPTELTGFAAAEKEADSKKCCKTD